MQGRWRARGFGILMAALAGLTACAALAQGTAPRKVTYLNYNVAPDLGDAQLWIVPHALGYFAEEGLDVTIQQCGGSSGALQLLAAGKGDIASSTPDQLMLAIQQGLKVKSFFEHNRTYGSALVVPKSSGVTTVEGLKTYLKGSAIGVGSLASGRVNYARAWIRDLGLKEDVDVKLVAVGTGAQAAAALKADRVRALSIYDAVYSLIEMVSDIRFTRFETSWQKPLFSGVLVAGDTTIEKDPDLVARYGRAVAKGLVFATTNPEAVVRIYWKLYPENRPKPADEASELKRAMAIVNSMLPNWLAEMDKPGAKWGRQALADWEQNQDFNFAAGVLKDKRPAADYFTDRFTDQYNQFDAAAIRHQAESFTEAMIKDPSPK